MERTFKRSKPVSNIKRPKSVVAISHPLSIVRTPSIDVKNVFSKSTKYDEFSISTEKKLVTTTWDGIDPLSAALSYKESFPISNENGINQKPEKSSFIENDFVNWQTYKSKILNKFNTNEKLSIKSSFLKDNAPHVNVAKVAQNVSQRVKNRLEQLDDFEESSMHEMYNLSQQEYIKRIDELRVALNEAWESDQKVKALKIAIQCAKQLSTINVIHFYPSKFVLITDILDNFGQLVYERIYNKTTDVNENFNIAQETCKNWFYKISSIRELLPRFYIETSILNVYRFLITENVANEYEKIFIRLTKIIRGIGNPLFASYCRVYLCRTVIYHYPQAKFIFEQNIYDIFNTIHQLNCVSVQKILVAQKVDHSVYYSLFTPAFDWIFNCLFYKADEQIFENVLNYFHKLKSLDVHHNCLALLLTSLITSLPPNIILKHLMEFIQFVTHFHTENLSSNRPVYPIYIVVKNIGESLNTIPNLFETESNEKLIVLKEFWKITAKFNSKEEYITCLESWTEIISKYYDLNEINSLLGDIVANLTPNREFENYSSQLLTILSKFVQFGSDHFNYNTFFSMNNLMPYLDLFHKEDFKVDACKIIVSSFIKNFSRNDYEKSILNEDTNIGTSDPVILNSMVYLCKIMHDSINALSLEDEKRQISFLIASFIRCVSFNRDFEAQLNFYLESRSNFSNLDYILSFLVQKVNNLAMETHKIVKGFHTKKTTSFVNACIAFSFITIPSIEDIVMRLHLYLSSTHIALVNVSLPQTDAFLKSAITLLRQLPSNYEASDGKFYSNDEFLYLYVSQLLSTLIIVPDNPELGILYLFKGLYNVLKEYKFDHALNYKISIWINLLRFLSTCALDTYPYHVDKVDSNDLLYAQDEEFLKEIQIYFDIILKELLDILKRSQGDMDVKKQCNNAIELIILIINYTNAEPMSHVVSQLWSFVNKMNAKHNLKSLNTKMKFTLDLIKKTYKVKLHDETSEN